MSDQAYDVVMVGAGPTSLAAAIYTSREELRTLVLDAQPLAGGMIATTDQVDNYPGFPEGVGGVELAERMQKQAERFGAEVKPSMGVMGVSQDSQEFVLQTAGGQVRAWSILLAPGTDYRKLGVPGEAGLIGKGVHYCATCDGPLYRDKHLIAVGGGNSVLQEGLFLTKFASKLTVLVRGPQFKGTEILAEAMQKNPKVEVRFNTPVNEVLAQGGKFRGVKTPTETIMADGLFVFVGLVPHTAWLGGLVELDERKFIKVDSNFATSVPGIFAAGDVRSGSTGQIASAVGEGVSAAISIRRHLDPNHQI